MSELEIIQGCIRNDRKAQKQLFDRYKNAMYTIALRMLDNSDDAHDILQEAFLDIFEHISELRNPSAAAGWIKTIVVRKSLHKLKCDFASEPLSKAEAVAISENNSDFTAAELELAISKLPEGARAVFLLVEVEGYKHAEIANMLGIGVGTSKSQLHYAKGLLQKMLLHN